MIPAIVNFENHTPGDTWQGVPTIGPIRISIDGATPIPMSAPVASARLHWVQANNYSPAAMFSTAPEAGVESPILIVGAAENWELSIPPVPPELFPLTRGKWFGHLEITDTDGAVWTTHECRLSVGDDYTR